MASSWSPISGFLIVDRNANGEAAERQPSRWAITRRFLATSSCKPSGYGEGQAAPFIEFIKRACLHAAPLTKPKDVAWFLASYARDALFRVERQKELAALQAVRSGLEMHWG